MISRIRLNGRALLIGNTTIMTMLLAVGIMLFICINMAVPGYEIYIRDGIGDKRLTVFADISASLAVILLCRGVWLQIRLGADRYFFRLADNKGARMSDIFYYFHPLRAFSAFFYKALLSAVKLPFLLVALFPPLLCFFIVNRLSYEGVSSLVALTLVVGCMLLSLNSVLFYRRVSGLLFLSDYIFISGEYLSFRQIFTFSVMTMKAHAKTLIRLKRSFYGWLLLCILILPAGYVWSYYRQTLAVAAAKFLDG